MVGMRSAERRVSSRKVRLDALARQQLLPLAVAAHVFLAAAGARQRQLLLQGADLLEHGRMVHPVRLGPRVDACGEDGHQIWRIFATTCFITSSAPPPMLTRRESTKARAAGFSQQ